PGAAAALYGPIAFNGLLSLHSKDPFKYQGLTVQMKTGINHINDPETDIHGYNDYAIRYATALSKRFAFKINASYTNGLDWYANNYSDFSAQTPVSQRGPNNPGRDAIHIYGDEVQKVLTGIGLVSRTGYEDKYLSDYNVYNTKINGAIHFKIKPNLVLIASQLFGKGNSNYNGSSRYSTRDLAEFISKLELKGEDFFVRSYRVWENLGDYYNTRTLAQLINRSWVKDLSGNIVSRSMADQMWFTRYEEAYKGMINGVTAANHMMARAFADQGRLMPGTNEYESIKSNIIQTFVPNGSRVYSNSFYYHTEGQYSFHDKLKTLDVIVGGNIRNFNLVTKETLLGDKDSKHIRLSEFGIFTQVTKRLVDDKLRLTGSLRYDKNQNFNGKLTPRFSAVYQTSKDGYLRASFQTGFRNPTIVDQYVMLRSGATLLLGGVRENSNGMQIYENSFTSASVFKFTNAYNAAMAMGKTVQESLNASIGLLKKADVPYISPEKQSAMEIGYKAEISHRFTIDINTYYSMYKNFIVNTVVESVPTTILQNDGSINPTSATDLINGKGQLYQLYTNSDANVSAFGISSGVTYYTKKGYQLSANATYSQLNTKELDVNIYAPFNTPPWSTNLSISNPDVFKHFGFNVNWHWQDTFLWYGTFLGNRPGPVHAFSMVDMQVSRKIPKNDILIKLGGSNVLNHRVAQVFGGPETGAIYYISIVLGK
ncbi:MAG: TonB-dependent receptor domain-containing protein, partial [Chitinophagaceae bacterium]